MAQKYCSIATLQVSPRKSGTNTPLKIYEQLASGIPIVATDIYSHTQVLNKDVAILVEPTEEEFTRGIIEVLKSDKKNIEKITEKAKELYQQKYSRPVYTNKMKRMLELLSICVE